MLLDNDGRIVQAGKCRARRNCIDDDGRFERNAVLLEAYIPTEVIPDEATDTYISRSPQLADSSLGSIW